ncbi:MAG: hypothetical protein ABI251_01730 [Mycobacteriaceae bacterium]
MTVVVADLDIAIELYHHGIGLQPLTFGTISRVAAAGWNRPSLRGCRWTSLAASCVDRPGVIRVIEVPGVIAPRPLTTAGWAAAEVIVADADAAMVRAQAAGLEVLAEPAAVGSAGGLRAVQVAGPAGEGLYLTQVTRPPPGFELPMSAESVGRVFIAVLASRDLEVSRDLLEGVLGARRITDHLLPVRALNVAWGLPPGEQHRISTVQLATTSAIEVDQYPAPTGTRLQNIDGISGGILSVAVKTGVAPRILIVPAADGALLELIP